MQKGKDIFMTTLEIQTKKDRLISDILQKDAYEVLKEMEAWV